MTREVLLFSNAVVVVSALILYLQLGGDCILGARVSLLVSKIDQVAMIMSLYCVADLVVADLLSCKVCTKCHDEHGNQRIVCC